MNDQQLMKRALKLAKRALGRTSPNPVVGAVIVDKDGNIVGEGYHKKAGLPHAEREALKVAGEKARGATMYVTLEPCCHYGRTPPCTEAIIAAGIKKVVVAVRDPNPKVSGKGIEILQNAGIEVIEGVLADEAFYLNEKFFKFIKTGLPFISLKWAMTVDGKIATETYDSRWVSGEKSRSFVHRLRNEYDAVLVGGKTLIIDNPLLTCRIPRGRNPYRIVLSGSGNLPEDLNIFRLEKEKNILITANKKLPKHVSNGFGHVITAPLGENRINIKEALYELIKLGIISILVEGGAVVHASLLQNRLADKAYVFIAPKIVGGKNAPGPIGDLNISLMKDALPLAIHKLRRFGEDVFIEGYFTGGSYVYRSY
ncbi:bifunctional diaminohydroxyphosphoribosylaminopyrimidine deaminase/5-amino-6-(5-phosphoribosylamino)uracil reductase [Carboxydothermus islandicus]|uniref:Riboflavin biosynthesis protein RibD n=1 Tax=Carboxydothermus islandicus TaxID=661089 RepID=A0A1L8D1N0_9THEO|nr:bifunctional diaminohydroxyphosphoribosylaminopyrimidine deaminase/5-amino-6-(5-phosphoribosylamino)uracil reductase RibD [Carboxydothermus islandicus]GAV25017.1 bifunctional diaminohydroxyphosphoribosylaminopyrimidine deaminase/5-amino-6-(5-phosphoribosylamino)uracil reductase [Carboxydothermus islandicus]